MELKKNKMKRSGYLFAGIMLLIPILHFVIFWVFVNADTILLSFQRFNRDSGGMDWVGFANYAQLFRDLANPYNNLGIALKNSLILFVWNDFVLLPVSLLCAYLLFKKMVFAKGFRVIFFLPSIISVVVLTMVFGFVFDSSHGIINPFLKAVGLGNLIPVKFGWLGDKSTAFGVILFYGLWSGIGANIVLMTGAMKRLPVEIFEAGKIDGISMFKEFIHVVIPLLGSTLATLLLMGTTVIFTYFLQPKLLTNGEADTFTLALYVVNSIRDDGNLTMGAALGMLCAVVGAPIVIGGRFLLDRFLPAYEY